MAGSYLLQGGGVEIDDNTVEPKRCSLNLSKVLPYPLVLVMLGKGCTHFSMRALQKPNKPDVTSRSSQEIHAIRGSLPSSFPRAGRGLSLSPSPLIL